MMLNRSILEALFNNMNHRVLYGYGDKANPLSQDSANISKLDCSGFTQFCCFRSARITIPEGSVEQHEWAQSNLKSVPLVEARAERTNTVYQCFIVPSSVNNNIGHTYFMMNGSTFESCGGVQFSPIYDREVDGVMSRSVEGTPVLLNETSAAYEWPSTI